MSRRYFGTDGIRGRVGSATINPEFMLRLGNALGRVLRNAGQEHPTVTIGKDTRISGYMFESALEAGLVAAGANVQLLGPMPTPAVAYLTRSMRADAGIVISASHNPHEDNGIKLFCARGEKLDDATERAIEDALDAPFETTGSELLGKATRISDAAARYVEFCKSTVPVEFRLAGTRIALDCAHGATYQVAPRVFGELGAELSAIGAAPDGLNINRAVGSTAPAALIEHVKTCGVDLGIAFDGDGDRVQMVDASGRLVDGDDLLYILAMDWHHTGRLKGPVAGTLMTNFGLEQALERAGIGFRRTKVGDRYVHQALVSEGGTLGGETSGHVLCLDRASTGDAIVAALQVLEVLVRRKLSLTEALQGLVKVPQRTVSLRVSPGVAPLDSERVQAELEQAKRQLEGRGRVVLRPSGTEPVIRVTVEAAEAALMDSIVDRLSAAVSEVSAASAA